MDNYKELIERLRTESLYKDKATLEIMDLCMEAANALAALTDENARLHAKLERAKAINVAYEDAGLEPKQVQKISNVFRQFGEEYNCWFDYVVDFVCKYAKAEQDGLLVMLPCKVGSTVYRVVTTRDCLPILSELKIKTIGQAVDLIGKIGKHRVLSYYLTREEAEAALKENAR